MTEQLTTNRRLELAVELMCRMALENREEGFTYGEFVDAATERGLAPDPDFAAQWATIVKSDAEYALACGHGLSLVRDELRRDRFVIATDFFQVDRKRIKKIEKYLRLVDRLLVVVLAQLAQFGGVEAEAKGRQVQTRVQHLKDILTELLEMPMPATARSFRKKKVAEGQESLL